MEQGKFINRKTFLRLAALTVVSAIVALWNRLADRHRLLLETPVEHRVNAARLGTGIFLFDTFILTKSEGGMVVFSNKCTHAGCRINKESDGELLCPCHGSRFDAASGKVLQGPAGIPLQKVPFSVDAKTGELVLKI